MLSAIKERLFGKTRTSTAMLKADLSKPLWIDTDLFHSRINEIDDPEIQNVLRSMRENGFGILRGNNTTERCDELVQNFLRYTQENQDSSEYCDEHGLYERLANFHLVSNQAAEILNSEKTVKTLECLFGEKPKIVGSLYFDKGSAQDIHRDTPAFFTNPFNRYVGVWNALEDVVEDSGALEYFVGGHRVISDRDLYRTETVEKEYFKKIVSACENAGLRKEKFFAKKGDTLFWHPELPHGGSSRENVKQSRKSLVSHYMASSANIFSPRDFFNEHKVLPAALEHRYCRIGTLDAIDHGKPQFFHNRFEGNFDEF